eukprot:CAMPEP_0113314948 /NCGR_PEP_ID=MMETSP0010_2-20120614/10802_1 /TAXON_ID=216773 ORGANISM="Corethron hystrix, Strain 308" /NCGR_SAMPLE_ID=MMETSP0010_2 /ASSEMBLY_ACC=CAM_ASM_000155 /LENGTH=422 /DNA_ID=CAMNT_0000171331 /DNA_START=455 /DNA_END=1723 /DNA_ORIENTATION=+ /assembly_acc=CAM_ASM_000155
MALTFLVLGLTTDSLLLTENWIVKWEKNDSPKLKYVEKKHIRREMYLRKDGEILWGSIPNNFTVWEGKDGDFDLGISTAAPTNLKLRRIKDFCTPIAGPKAYTLSFPTCNSVHELGFTAEEFATNHGERDRRILKSKHEHSKHKTQIKFLGRGSWRDAWRLDQHNSILVLKTLKYKRVFDPYSFEKHRIDALVMERLSKSPYIADIFGLCGNSVVNEFGFMSGGKLQRKNLSSKEKLKFAAQASMGVADLHSLVLGNDEKGSNANGRATLIHLDLKPENFIISKDNVCKVHDFNLARFLENNIETGELCNVRRNDCNRWRSPEECARSNRISEKSDVYSLANFIFYLLTKNYPFAYDKKGNTQGKGKFPTIPAKYINSTKLEYQKMVEVVQKSYVFKQDDRISAREIANTLTDTLSSLHQSY